MTNKPRTTGILALAIWGLVSAACPLSPVSLDAQPAILPYPYYRPYGGINLVPLQNQIEQFQKTCRSAPGYYNNGGYDMLWRQFQALRTSYSAFKDTLGPNQLYQGANDLAELDAGLDIIQESFTNYQNQPANVFPASAPFNNLCSVLSRSVKVWSNQLQDVFYRLSSIHG